MPTAVQDDDGLMLVLKRMNYVDNTVDKVDKTLVHYMLTSLIYSC